MSKTAKAPTFKIGDLVTYKNHSVRVLAIVQTVHRAGEVSVRAKFCLNAAGKEEGVYLGYLYRMKAAVLTPYRDIFHNDMPGTESGVEVIETDGGEQ